MRGPWGGAKSDAPTASAVRKLDDELPARFDRLERTMTSEVRETRQSVGEQVTTTRRDLSNVLASLVDANRAALDGIEIDLYGTFFSSQAVLPIMKAQGGGSIVNISMTLHYRGWPLMAHATAAKAGIDALTKTLALEWAPFGVRMNAVAPGPIPTEGVRKAFTPPPSADGATDVFGVEKAMDSYARKMIPLQRWGSPTDIANAVAFLASPAGAWITGSIMVVDGGEWLAKPSSSP